MRDLIEIDKWKDYLKDIFLLENLENDIRDEDLTNEFVFYPFLKPFIRKVKFDTDKTLLKYNNLIDIEKIQSILIKSISASILNLSYKTLIYELNKARLSSELKGDTSKERYNYFLKNNLTNYSDILDLLLAYPVLTNLICELMKNKTNNFILMLERLLSDKDDIEKVLDIKLDKIINAEELGDSHNGGLNVFRLTDKNKKNIVYKPRSLKIDFEFQNLLKWFNENGILNMFKTIKIINKDNYGWQEYIPHKSCNNKFEIDKYYQRQGSYIAIFYMLNSIDFHYENLIANGEYPIYIDLESLMHPILENNEIEKSAFEKCKNILSNSVLKTALLPLGYDNKQIKFDVSGLGARIVNTVEVLDIINKNTDVMKLEKRKIKIKSTNHIPTISNNPYYPEKNIENILKGFENCYLIVMKNKEKLIQLIKQFKDIDIRVILRNTMLYSKFLSSSLHPKYLLNINDRKKLFELLGENDFLNNVVSLELESLLKHDIPYFSCKTDDKYLASIYEKKENFFNVTPIDSIINKIKLFSDEDCCIQKYFIETSILVNKSVLDEKIKIEKFDSLTDIDDSYLDKKLKSVLLNEAIGIAEKLKKSAIIQNNDTISWICIGVDDYENMNFSILDNTLYSGITGICLFYAYLNNITNNESYLEITKLCLNTILGYKKNKSFNNVSAFSGLGSILYCLANLYILWNEKWLLYEIKSCLKIIDNNIKNDSAYDFLSGCSGLLSICIDLYTNLNIKEALDIAILCGNHLLGNSIKINRGIGWKNKNASSKILAGLAHGNSGICYSLIKLYSITKKQIYLTTALEGIYYENLLYDNKENNWKDLRSFDDLSINITPIAWCNGAMGIGLSRIYMMKYYKDSTINEDFNNAFNKTIKEGFIGVNYSLCHGDLGNLELPLTTSLILKDKNLERKVYKKVLDIIEDVKKNNYSKWKCGIPGRYETESFMTGLSGIGYQLLRFYDNRIPNILMLDILESRL